jgi:serine/threonine-protein kinase RsbW
VPAVAHAVRLEIPAAYPYLRLAGACLHAVLAQAAGLREQEMLSYGVELAVHETCVNIVDHAYRGAGGRLELLVWLCPAGGRPRRLVVEVHDGGRAFELTEVKLPENAPAAQGGFGLYLIHQLMDEVTYEPQSGNNKWTLVKNLGNG